MPDNQSIPEESMVSAQVEQARPSLRAWVRVGAIAATSALAGGLAAAWYYRKTLKILWEAESSDGPPTLETPDSETGYEIQGE